MDTRFTIGNGEVDGVEVFRQGLAGRRNFLAQLTSRPVTKAEIVDRIAAGTGLTKLETEVVVDGFLHTIARALAEGDSVELRGFGSFRVKQRAARLARNPRTNEEVEVAAHYAPVFKPSREFKRIVNDALKRDPRV